MLQPSSWQLGVHRLQCTPLTPCGDAPGGPRAYLRATACLASQPVIDWAAAVAPLQVAVDRVRKDMYPQSAATAAVAADVYAVWRHVVPPGASSRDAAWAHACPLCTGGHGMRCDVSQHPLELPVCNRPRLGPCLCCRARPQRLWS